jgi:hypothetical protein
VVICPKTAPVGWWLAAGGVPKDLGFACAAQPNDARALRVLDRVLPRGSQPVFIGDLDPMGLVHYVELARNLARKNRRLAYGGLDDRWLIGMRRQLARAQGLDTLRIPLDRDELRLLARLDRAIDLDGLVGRDSAAMLRGGHKIEIEAATNPVLYRDGFARWAFRHLRQVGARKSA